MEIVWQEAVMFGSNMAPCQVIKIVFLLEDLVSFTMFYQVLHLHLCCYCMLPGISVLAQPFFPCLSYFFPTLDAGCLALASTKGELTAPVVSKVWVDAGFSNVE